MSAFQSFINFMESALNFMNHGAVFQIFLTIFVIWVFSLFFRIIRS